MSENKESCEHGISSPFNCEVCVGKAMQPQLLLASPDKVSAAKVLDLLIKDVAKKEDEMIGRIIAKACRIFSCGPEHLGRGRDGNRVVIYGPAPDRFEIARVWADTEGTTVIIHAEMVEELGE